jgi:hypothetical protein
MPDWRELYQAARIETNRNVLELLMDDTETAMWKRLRELDRGTNGTAERREIELASQELLSMRITKLGWPAPF